jgi:hypothetical protein
MLWAINISKENEKINCVDVFSSIFGSLNPSKTGSSGQFFAPFIGS